MQLDVRDRDDENVESVWAVIYLPSYISPETG